MYIQVKSQNRRADPRSLTIRCPNCHRLGTFQLISSDVELQIDDDKVVSTRQCPNETCANLVFFVYSASTLEIVASYPIERLDFDIENIPPLVANALEEAITCHANEAYMAAGMMVRRALEEGCRERDAQGKDLYHRIEELKNRVVLPKELFDAMHRIRLFGNDAALIEAETYHRVSREEVEVAIDLSKELLKAVYQYSNLVERLERLSSEQKNSTR